MPPGVVWIVPSEEGTTDADRGELDALALKEVEGLAARFRTAHRQGWFAASRKATEDLGFAFFPVLLTLDFQGTITSIRIGEAAPDQP